MIEKLRDLAKEKNIELNHWDYSKNKVYYKSRLKAEIARSLWGTNRYYQVLLLNDNQYTSALDLFYQAENILHPEPENNLVNKLD